MPSPDTPKKIVRVNIFNQTYAVSSSDDAEVTEELARTVDELMASIARRAGNLDTARTAVLACLHLADRLRRAEVELEELRSAVSEKSRKFSVALDTALIPNGGH